MHEDSSLTLGKTKKRGERHFSYEGVSFFVVYMIFLVITSDCGNPELKESGPPINTFEGDRKKYGDTSGLAQKDALSE